ncbi:MAG: BTAD domain-containing putative transcriptional regulator, partial [Actinomycetota bacterium]
RRLAAPILTRVLDAAPARRAMAARIAAACGREVFADCVSAVRAPGARAALAAVAGEGSEVEIASLGRLVRDADPGVRAAASRSERRILTRPRPPVRLVTLGGLTVWRGDAQVPDSAFVRRKARGILAALACARGPVHREMLVEWFWPALPPERGLAALYVTLHDLRRALEPDLGRGVPSSLIVGEDEAYRLVLGPRDRWDVAEFLDLAAAGGDDGLAGLEAAEAAYTGRLLPEWPFEEWCASLRVEVEDARVSVLERLAAALLKAGRSAEAAVRYQALLGVDAEREAWHRGLMRAYARSGELALALRQYHACRAQLRRAQGTEPSGATRALYAEILGAG